MAELREPGGDWNRDLIIKEFLSEDYQAIISIPLSRIPREDALAWFYEPKGVYSVKSGYHVDVDHMDKQWFQRRRMFWGGGSHYGT